MRCTSATVQPHELDYAPPLVQKLAYEESSMADAGYLMVVQKAIVDAVESVARARAGHG